MIERLLLVDDDEGVLENLIGYMHQIRKETGLDFEIEYARDGLDAFELLKKSKYSMIIMDLTMPIMSGEDVIDALESKETKNKNTNIVLLSGDPNSLVNYKNKDHVLILQKPFSYNSLEKAVKRTLMLKKGS